MHRKLTGESAPIPTHYNYFSFTRSDKKKVRGLRREREKKKRGKNKEKAEITAILNILLL